MLPIKNLFYSSLVTSWQHLSYFPLIFFLGMATVVFFSLPLFWLFYKSFKGKWQNFLLLAGPYFGLSFFVLITDLFVRFGLSYSSSVLMVFLSIVLMSIVSLVRLWSLKRELVNKIPKNKTNLLFVVCLTLFSTFLLSKFIYGNGLHDEYQHHAVVEDMLRSEHWPIRDEIRYGLVLSDYYHYGWYFLIILIKKIFFISTELALDVAKIAFFLPVMPLMYWVLGLLIPKLKPVEKTLFSLTLVFQGPSLFFLDSYSRNVLLSQSNVIIYQPLFFQLAGITWHGLTLSLVILLAFYHLVENRKYMLLIFFVGISFHLQLLMNKAYLILLLFGFFAIFFQKHLRQIGLIWAKKKKVFFVLSAVALMLSSLTLFFLLRSSTMLFNLIFNQSGIPFLRKMSDWGLPYSDDKGLAFAKFFDIDTLFSFGLLPVLSIVYVVLLLFSKKIRHGILIFWLVIAQSVLFIAAYLVNFSGSELALNKYFIPMMGAATLSSIAVYSSCRVVCKKILLILILSGLLPVLLYFSSLSLIGEQIYWNKSDPIIDYLKQNENERPLLIQIEDFEYGKYLANNLNVQIITAKIATSSGVIVDFIVSKNNFTQTKVLVKTDEKLLLRP